MRKNSKYKTSTPVNVESSNMNDFMTVKQAKKFDRFPIVKGNQEGLIKMMMNGRDPVKHQTIYNHANLPFALHSFGHSTIEESNDDNDKIDFFRKRNNMKINS